MNSTSHDTSKQFDQVIAMCRKLFVAKIEDYGPSWRILRPSSLTDQILIKAKRIRTLEINGTSQVGEDLWPEFIAIVNYGIIGLIQLQLGHSDVIDMSREHAIELYDKYMSDTKALMLAKNADYGEAWRDMRVSSYTDIILTRRCAAGNGHSVMGRASPTLRPCVRAISMAFMLMRAWLPKATIR